MAPNWLMYKYKYNIYIWFLSLEVVKCEHAEAFVGS